MPYRLKKEPVHVRCPVFDCAWNHNLECSADEEEGELLFSYPIPCSCYEPDGLVLSTALSTGKALVLSKEGDKYAFVHAIKTAPGTARIAMGDQPSDQVVAIKYRKGTLDQYQFFWDEGIKFDPKGQTYLLGMEHQQVVLREPQA